MIYLVRYESNVFGTKGMLFLPNGWNCHTIEPPWLDNLPFQSCIPAGEYEVAYRNTPKHGWTFVLLDVPNRTSILFHVGNYAGDEESGYRTDTDGCILPGKNTGILGVQEVVLDSRTAFEELITQSDYRPSTITIKGEPITDRSKFKQTNQEGIKWNGSLG